MVTKVKPAKDVETPTEERKTRMHTLIFKKEDKEGNQLYLDCDQIIPLHLFGESFPMVMCIVDDRAFFVPFEQMHHFEQNFGVKHDTKVAQNMAQEKLAKSGKPTNDAAFN